jgi:hypothetical protein
MAATLPAWPADAYNVLSLQDHPDDAYGLETKVILTIHASIFARSSAVAGLNR